MPAHSFKHFSQKDQPLDEIMRRTLAAIRDYPSSGRDVGRRYAILYALNDLSDALARVEAVKSRPFLTPARNGAVVNNPVVEFWVEESDTDFTNQIGVLYQFAVDGEDVRFGLSYYRPEEAEDSDAEAKEKAWRERLSPLVRAFATGGFSTDNGNEAGELDAIERWDSGWLAWRTYSANAIPSPQELERDLSVAVQLFENALKQYK